MATVKLDAVSKYFDNNAILKNINLDIEKGEFVAVVGPSGSGKSTLLRLVAGLEDLSSGKILINNQCVNTIPAPKRNMAMVFQNYALYPHMSVYDNMAYGLKMRKMKKHLIRERVLEVAHILQLENLLERKPNALSGGQRQRVAMGRAMVRNPAVFLFDEPLSNLDTKLRAEMRHEIKKLHQDFNTTSLYVTHDQTEAMTLADKVVVVNHGEIEQVGRPRELYLKPATTFVASFIGHYPMNFIDGTVNFAAGYIETEIGINLPIADLSSDFNYNQEVTVGIRPENIALDTTSATYDVDTKIEWVDDMGSDKLLQLVTANGNKKLAVRTFTDSNNYDTNSLKVGLTLDKASVFCKQTGKRLGGFSVC